MTKDARNELAELTVTLKVIYLCLHDIFSKDEFFAHFHSHSDQYVACLQPLNNPCDANFLKQTVFKVVSRAHKNR